MLFSIVTVVLDDYEELTKTCNSVINQSYKNIEWVVIHGGKDNRIIEYLLHQQTYLNIKYISEPDEGIYDAMNKGITLSTGEFILFLNAGDLLHNDSVILNVSNKIKGHSSIPDVVFGAVELTFSNGKRIVRLPKNINSYIWHGIPAIQQATYYKKCSIRKIPYDLKYKMCGDYYIIARMFLNNIDVIIIQDVLADFKIGGFSYLHPRLLIKDSYDIQKNILRLPFIIRIISAIKRFLAIMAIVIIQNID